MSRRFLVAGFVLLLSFASYFSAFSQKVGVKTNLIYDVTSTINLGVVVSLSDRWTLDISGNYNPWKFSNDRKIKHFLIQPEARFWTCESFNGHFFGLHAHYGMYNASGMLPFWINAKFMQGKRFEGWVAGAGLSYGYQWILSPHWGIEATIGAGYSYLNYDTYRCTNCGKLLASDVSRNYFGITKMGLSIIYLIK